MSYPTDEAEQAQEAPTLILWMKPGDGVIFDAKGRVLVGTGAVQDHFSVGIVECRGLNARVEDYAILRTQLLGAPNFKGLSPEIPKALWHLPYPQTPSFGHSENKKSEGRGLSGNPTITRHEAEFHLPTREV